MCLPDAGLTVEPKTVEFREPRATTWRVRRGRQSVPRRFGAGQHDHLDRLEIALAALTPYEDCRVLDEVFGGARLCRLDGGAVGELERAGSVAGAESDRDRVVAHARDRSDRSDVRDVVFDTVLLDLPTDHPADDEADDERCECD